ncbi:unnamed protein product [Sphagnum troendelagicum]|uniref:Uncharacterized protein n=1 Tax=Sphagnum troendelagicum TaxID=128251 RepID=A0ABP0T7S0_9BRYO
MQRFLYISGTSPVPYTTVTGAADKEEEEEEEENRVSLRMPRDMQDADLKKSGNRLRELELPSKRKIGNICPVMEARWSGPCRGRRCEKEAPASPQFHQIPDFFMKLMIALFLVLNLRVQKLRNIGH